MKKILFLLPLLFLMVIGYGQRIDIPSSLSTLPDTLTNADTLTYAVTKAINYESLIGVYSRADSLSGSTAATIYYEASNDNSTWFQVGTDTINGTVSHNDYTGTAYYKYFRVRIISSGTQSTKVDLTIGIKRKL